MVTSAMCYQGRSPSYISVCREFSIELTIKLLRQILSERIMTMTSCIKLLAKQYHVYRIRILYKDSELWFTNKVLNILNVYVFKRLTR